MNKLYLGDSVYAEYDDLGRVILTTENGVPSDPSNTIVLEPEVLLALSDYVTAQKKVAALVRESEL